MTARLDWYGCATFRLTVGPLVIFLDAYIDRVPSAAGTGLRADDVERADWIVVGHSHFDHLWGAERIARRTGATIIGSHETVRIMEQEGVPLAQLLPVGGGERIRLSPEVTVAVYPSLHSCVWTPKGGMVQPDEVCLGDLGVTYQERMARLQEVMQGLVKSLEGVVPVVHCLPIGHHPALEAKHALHHAVQKSVVAAVVRSIDPVGAARERARLRALDRALKREQIGFAMRDRLDDGVEPECFGFVAIERDVLEHRDDALRLRADDRLGRDDGAQLTASGHYTPVWACTRPSLIAATRAA